jgi:hypothetical protein
MKVISIHNFISSSGSGTVINYGSGSDFLTSYGSGSFSKNLRFLRFRFRFHNAEQKPNLSRGTALLSQKMFSNS